MNNTQYDPVKCLKDEVDRFKKTNTFSPMLVTGFYLHAACVLDELEMVRNERDHYRKSNETQGRIRTELYERCEVLREALIKVHEWQCKRLNEGGSIADFAEDVAPAVAYALEQA